MKEEAKKETKLVSGAGIGLVMGVAIGYSLGMIFGDWGLWTALGAAFGLIFGPTITVKRKNKKQIPD